MQLIRMNLLEFGWQYELVLLMLAIVVIVDAFSMIRLIKASHEDIVEYAELCVKFLKLVLCFFAGIYFVYSGFVRNVYDTATRGIVGTLGVLLVADAVSGLIIKLKFARKNRKI